MKYAALVKAIHSATAQMQGSAAMEVVPRIPVTPSPLVVVITSSGIIESPSNSTDSVCRISHTAD